MVQSPPASDARKGALNVQTDLIVLGGGSAAFAAAIQAAEMGKTVALVEGGTIGGTCVNVGCVPSKTLIAAAAARQAAQNHPFRGISTVADGVDFPAVIGQKDDLVRELRQAKYIDVLKSYPSVRLVQAMGRVVSAEPLVVEAGGERLSGRRLVVATGSRPAVPPIDGLQGTPYWTSTEALDAAELPESLIVIGGSAVGLEIAQFYARVGSNVTVIEAMDHLVPLEDADVGSALASWLEADGLRIITGATVRSVSHDGEFTVTFEEDGRNERVHGARLLVATGRSPNAAGFGLEKLGVGTDRRGFIVTDEHQATSVDGIYAAGDVTGHAMFVYVAAYEGGLAARNAFGESGRRDLRALPRVTFTDPQVAAVGLTEEAAEATGISCSCRVLPLEYVPRALASRDTRGFVKIVAEVGTGKVLGVHILAPDAGEMIQPAVFAVKYEMTLDDIRDNFFPYLTMTEGLKLAALAFTKDVSKLSCCAG